VTETAGRLVESGIAERVVATIHPSAVLRARSGDARDELLERLIGDLRLVADLAA
jgi:DNA polymerase